MEELHKWYCWAKVRPELLTEEIRSLYRIREWDEGQPEIELYVHLTEESRVESAIREFFGEAVGEITHKEMMK